MIDRVSHIIWGAGSVSAVDDRYVRVLFDRSDIGERTFVYPDAFSKYLKYDDAAKQAEIDTVLAERARADAERFEAEEQKRRQAAADALEKERENASKRRRAIAYSRKRAQLLKIKPTEKSE